MKNKHTKWIIALLVAAIFTFGLTGCPDPDPKPSADRTKAELLGIKVFSVITNDEGDRIKGDPINVDPDTYESPQPITATQWEAWIDGEYDLEDEQTGLIWIRATSPLDAILDITVSANAKVLFTGSLNEATKPNDEDHFINQSGGEDRFIDTQFKYIKVTSGDGKTTNYYRFLLDISGYSVNLAIGSFEVGGVPVPTAQRGVANNNGFDGALGWVGLSTASKEGEVDVTPTAATTKVQYGRSAAAGPAPTDDQLTDTLTAEGDAFSDGDIIYVKLTSEHGQINQETGPGNTAYHRVEVRIGRDATLAATNGLRLQGTSATAVEALALGTPAATAAAAVSAVLPEMTVVQPTTGFIVLATPTDPDATVTYGKASGSAAPTFAASNVVQLLDGESLYVQVVSANGGTTLVYRFNVQLLNATDIPYASGIAIDAVNVDPRFQSMGAHITVGRLTAATGDRTTAFASSFSAGNSPISAESWVLWDDQGVLVYTIVTDSTLTTATAATDSNAHTYDSVEVFIAEQWPVNPNIWGGSVASQYRVSNTGVRTAQPTGTGAALSAFTAGHASASQRAPGYHVVMRAPFRNNTAQPKANDKEIGFEVQINDARGTGGNTTLGNANGRHGVICWNSTVNNYQTTIGYGKGILSGRP